MKLERPHKRARGNHEVTSDEREAARKAALEDLRAFTRAHVKPVREEDGEDLLPFIKRGLDDLQAKQIGGRNKQPRCRRRSCNGALLSLCGHLPWEDEVTSMFGKARLSDPTLAKTTFAKRVKRRLDLTVSAGTIANVL